MTETGPRVPGGGQNHPVAPGSSGTSQNYPVPELSRRCVAHAECIMRCSHSTWCSDAVSAGSEKRER